MTVTPANEPGAEGDATGFEAGLRELEGFKVRVPGLGSGLGLGLG